MNTPTMPIDLSTLQTLLQQQDDEVKRCLETLAKIEQCICHNDSEGLVKQLQNPGMDIAHLEELRQQQKQLLAAAGYEIEKDGLEACVRELKIPALTALFEAAQHNWAQFERALALNDRLIRNNQQRVRQSIQILAGRMGAESNATYSSQGSAQNYDSAQRTLAKA